ncbi:MAG TPA: hypothetical protein VFJ19_14150 [Nocardioidaceae bacterium]|nr:hypothetical protein [Nocardioidaceae bacterium]
MTGPAARCSTSAAAPASTSPGGRRPPAGCTAWTRSTFGRWFRRGYPDVDPAAVERFWSAHGWTRLGLDVEWQFDSRADLEAVVRIELDGQTADAVLAEHEGTRVDYAVNLWWRR